MDAQRKKEKKTQKLVLRTLQVTHQVTADVMSENQTNGRLKRTKQMSASFFRFSSIYESARFFPWIELSQTTVNCYADTLFVWHTRAKRSHFQTALCKGQTFAVKSHGYTLLISRAPYTAVLFRRAYYDASTAMHGYATTPGHHTQTNKKSRVVIYQY